jgi:hypothetical protein
MGVDLSSAGNVHRRNGMLIEQRIYTLQPGKVGTYLELYESRGLSVQKEILGKLVGYYYTEFGHLNQIVHMWAYDNLAERQDRRDRLYNDERWKILLPDLLAMIVKMENHLFRPAPFFDLSRIAQ